MPNDLVTYIKTSLEKGVSKERVIDELVKRGYTEDQIVTAFKLATQPAPSKPLPAAPSGSSTGPAVQTTGPTPATPTLVTPTTPSQPPAKQTTPTTPFTIPSTPTPITSTTPAQPKPVLPKQGPMPVKKAGSNKLLMAILILVGIGIAAFVILPMFSGSGLAGYEYVPKRATDVFVINDVNFAEELNENENISVGRLLYEREFKKLDFADQLIAFKYKWDDELGQFLVITGDPSKAEDYFKDMCDEGEVDTSDDIVTCSFDHGYWTEHYYLAKIDANHVLMTPKETLGSHVARGQSCSEEHFKSMLEMYPLDEDDKYDLSELSEVSDILSMPISGVSKQSGTVSVVGISKDVIMVGTDFGSKDKAMETIETMKAVEEITGKNMSTSRRGTWVVLRLEGTDFYTVNAYY